MEVERRKRKWAVGTKYTIKRGLKQGINKMVIPPESGDKIIENWVSSKKMRR